MQIQVGDSVLFTPHKGHAYAGDGRRLKYFGEPLAAIVARVIEDKGMVNLSVIDAEGRQYGQMEVPFLVENDALPQQGFYCVPIRYALEPEPEEAPPPEPDATPTPPPEPESKMEPDWFEMNK